MHVHHPPASSTTRRPRARTAAAITIAASALILGAPTASASGQQCSVDVSDWPIGVLPDRANDAIGPVAAVCLAPLEAPPEAVAAP